MSVLLSWIEIIERSKVYWFLVSYYGLYPMVTSIVWIVGGMIYYCRRDFGPPKAEGGETNLPMVSILIPAYCEEATIAQTLEGAVRLDYPNFEIIVINDGSVDGTVERVRPFLADPRVRLLDKRFNEGKAMALNDALACAKGDLVLVMDADSIPDPMILRRMVPHFQWPRVGAVAGNPRVRNRRTLLARLQAVEFTSVIGLLRRAQRTWGRVMCVSGVCGMFRKEAIIDAGMYSPGMATEDIDLTWKLQFRHWDVRYEARALVWMVVPETIPVWWAQRRRWAKGLGQVLRRHATLLRHWWHRDMYPIVFESALSLIWSVIFVAVSLFWLFCYAIGHPPLGGSPIPNMGGMLLFSTCLLQLGCGIMIDAKYDKSILADAPVAVIYPLFYWALLAVSSSVYSLRGLFGRLDMKHATTWRLNKGIVQVMLLSAILLLPMMARAAESPKEMGDRARELARKGETTSALALYYEALKTAPDDPDLRCDYAIVLGWAERYTESIAEFRKVVAIRPEEPLWALAEMARSQLFGGATEDALETLNMMSDIGDRSETTYVRKGLALRWLGRPLEAEQHYREALKEYPDSAPLMAGLAYSLADRGLMSQALVALDGVQNADASIARARILSWMGRPSEAKREANSVAATFPQNREAVRLRHDLELEYGNSASAGFRLIRDSDNLTDRTWWGEACMHWTPAHRLRFGAEYRQMLENGTETGWRKYEAGWSGVLAPRLGIYLTLADHEYFSGLRRWTGDGSFSLALGNHVQISAGGGVAPMDAFQSMLKGVTGEFWTAGAAWRPSGGTSLEVKTSDYFFSDGVRRTRLDASGSGRLVSSSRIRLEAGGRMNLLWHNQETQDFFSPSFFQSYLALIRAHGELFRRFEYRAECAGDCSRNPG